MKLRNKKTGKIGELSGVNRIVVYEYDMPLCGNSILGEYDTLAELNEEWEDYTPAEPLIKDEKIRKAVRAWAEAVGGSPVCFYEDTGYEGVGRLKIYREGYPAVFDLGHQFYDLELDNQYTIAELCGEEEE